MPCGTYYVYYDYYIFADNCIVIEKLVKCKKNITFINQYCNINQESWEEYICVSLAHAVPKPLTWENRMQKMHTGLRLLPPNLCVAKPEYPIAVVVDAALIQNKWISKCITSRPTLVMAPNWYFVKEDDQHGRTRDQRPHPLAVSLASAPWPDKTPHPYQDAT